VGQISVVTTGQFSVVTYKNMKGWIYGNSKQRFWTQKIYNHSSKYQNPLHQNYKHVKILQQLLGVKSNQIYSLVVFIGDSTFKTQLPENVTSGFGYASYIKSKKEPVLTRQEVAEIITKIEQGRLCQSFKTHMAHVKYVKTAQSRKRNIVVCPKCGSAMKLRESKNGNKFWGCSRFPKCRGTKSI